SHIQLAQQPSSRSPLPKAAPIDAKHVFSVTHRDLARDFTIQRKFTVRSVASLIAQRVTHATYQRELSTSIVVARVAGASLCMVCPLCEMFTQWFPFAL